MAVQRLCMAIRNRAKLGKELEEENYKLEKVNYEQVGSRVACCGN